MRINTAASQFDQTGVCVKNAIVDKAGIAKDNITRTTTLGEDTATTVGKRYCDRQR